MTLQLDNSDWSVSSSSSCCLSDDCILTPVGRNDVENTDSLDSGNYAVADVNDETNALVAEISANSAPIQRHHLAHDTATIQSSEIPENNFTAVEVDQIHSPGQHSSECEMTADNRPAVIEENSTIVDENLVRRTSSPIESVDENNPIAEKNFHSVFHLPDSVQDHILVEKVNGVAYEGEITNGIDDIDLSPESPVTDITSDQCTAPKHVEIITLEERDAEIDCGVEPLPDPPAELALESNSSPVRLSPPPQQLVTPVEAIPDSVSTAVPWITKKKSDVSSTLAEVVKHGSVIIRARGKILRKSSRKKTGPNKQSRRKDSFQEYLEQAFELKPFIIKLDKYRTGSEANEAEKLNFLSNFSLQKKGVFPVYSEHAYARYNFKSPRHESTLKARRSNLSKIRKVNKKSSVAMRKKKPQTDLSKLSIYRTINAVEIERLEESTFARAVGIQREHSYNHFNDQERRVSNDFSLIV